MPSSELPAAAPSAPATVVAASMPRSLDAGAWSRLLACMRVRFWLKAVGTAAFMWLFFVGYFHLLRHPTQPPIVMPLTVLDRWIGFQSWALWPYVSLWVYVAVPPALMPSLRTLIRYGWWIGALCVAGLACFYLWPTAVPRQALAVAGTFEVLRGVDAAGNACPSLHVAAATFSALWIERLLRDLGVPNASRWLNAAWYLLIVWSTLATKQHVWWDVVAGLILAIVVGWLSLRGWSAARGR